MDKDIVCYPLQISEILKDMEHSVYIHSLVRFVTGFLGRGEEAKKNHGAELHDF